MNDIDSAISRAFQKRGDKNLKLPDLLAVSFATEALEEFLKWKCEELAYELSGLRQKHNDLLDLRHYGEADLLSEEIHKREYALDKLMGQERDVYSGCYKGYCHFCDKRCDCVCHIAFGDSEPRPVKLAIHSEDCPLKETDNHL